MPEFDAETWAMGHEALCSERAKNVNDKLGLIMKAGGSAMALATAIIIGLLGWSLKTNYDTLHTTVAEASATRTTVDKKATEVETTVHQENQ